MSANNVCEKDKQLMNLQKVIREMAKRKGPKMRRTSPEECGVLLGTPQRRRAQYNEVFGTLRDAIKLDNLLKGESWLRY